MLAVPEHYKGISFIRISNLPAEQKLVIRENYNSEAIIKIIKDNTLLNDCILYPEYTAWYKKFKNSNAAEIISAEVSTVRFSELAAG